MAGTRKTRVPMVEQIRLINECRQSGVTDADWCRENDIAVSTFYNWVMPCCLDAYGQASLGNIWETPLQDILTSKQAEDMRRGFQEGRLVHALCQRCQYRTRFDGKRRRMR
mgnify:CR=1 FL=1